MQYCIARKRMNRLNRWHLTVCLLQSKRCWFIHINFKCRESSQGISYRSRWQVSGNDVKGSFTASPHSIDISSLPRHGPREKRLNHLWLISRWLHLIISAEDLQSKIPKLPKLPIISCPKQCVKTPGSTIGSIVTPLRRTFQGSKTAGTSLIKVWFYESMFRCKRNAKEFFWTWT